MTRINRAVMRRNSDRGRLVQTGTLVCGAVGLDTDLSLVYQLFALLICLLIFSRLSLRLQVPNVTVRRWLPRYATAEEPFEYRITVDNSGDRVERDLKLTDNPKVIPPDKEQFRRMREPFEETRNAYDRWIGFHRFVYLQKLNTGITIKTADVPDIEIKGRVEVSIEATPVRRGNVYFESTTVLHPDPLGLNFGALEFPARDHLMVLPKRYPVAHEFLMTTGRNFQPGGVNAAWSIGESDEFVSLRDYRDGDPIRKIHWASSAKREKPVVKEFQDEFFVRQALVFDSSRPMDAASEHEIFEAQITVAASLLAAIPANDGLMDLCTLTDKPGVITAGRGTADLSLQLEALAILQPTEADSQEFIAMLSERARQLSGCIFVLNQYTQKQQAMITAIASKGTACQVFIVTAATSVDAAAAPEVEYFEGAILIPANQVGEALMALSSASVRQSEQ